MEKRLPIAMIVNLARAQNRNGTELTYTYDTQADRTGITALLADLAQAGIRFKDLHTSQSSLEEIFVGLLKERA